MFRIKDGSTVKNLYEYLDPISLLKRILINVSLLYKVSQKSFLKTVDVPSFLQEPDIKHLNTEVCPLLCAFAQPSQIFTRTPLIKTDYFFIGFSANS